MNKKFLIRVIILAIAVEISIGWFMNIHKLTQCDFKAPYNCEILRGIGIPIIPMGVSLGYITIED